MLELIIAPQNLKDYFKENKRKFIFLVIDSSHSCPYTGSVLSHHFIFFLLPLLSHAMPFSPALPLFFFIKLFDYVFLLMSFIFLYTHCPFLSSHSPSSYCPLLSIFLTYLFYSIPSFPIPFVLPSPFCCPFLTVPLSG